MDRVKYPDQIFRELLDDFGFVEERNDNTDLGTWTLGELLPAIAFRMSLRSVQGHSMSACFLSRHHLLPTIRTTHDCAANYARFWGLQSPSKPRTGHALNGLWPKIQTEARVPSVCRH